MGAWIEIQRRVRQRDRGRRRTLHGCVDWNSDYTLNTNFEVGSHPSWVRGLKYRNESWSCCSYLRRTLHGCVDWNSSTSQHTVKYVEVAPFMGAWIEIYRTSAPKYPRWGRTLHGCVDWNKYRRRQCSRVHSVAPFMGAWIEIDWQEGINFDDIVSHPSWVRGLKWQRAY